MRYVTALFDAPVPARTARRALEAAGFAPRDVALVPEPAGEERARDWAPGGDPPGLLAALRDLGVAEELAGAYAEGVARGCILVVVRCPDLSAPAAAAALALGPALDPGAAARRWRAEPTCGYVWSRVPPPELAEAEAAAAAPGSPDTQGTPDNPAGPGSPDAPDAADAPDSLDAPDG